MSAPVTDAGQMAPKVPSVICGYPLPGWRLDSVEWSEIEGQPDGWIVSLKRELPNWRIHRRAFIVMARSDIGLLEAWDEALQIAIREDARAEQLKMMTTEATGES